MNWNPTQDPKFKAAFARALDAYPFRITVPHRDDLDPDRVSFEGHHARFPFSDKNEAVWFFEKAHDLEAFKRLRFGSQAAPR